MKSENRIQQEAVMWFRNTFCRVGQVPRCMIFSVPNEGSNEVEQMRKIQTGLMSGASDLICLLPSCALFIECKDDKGRQSPKQIDFQKQVQDLCFKYYLIRSLDDFQKIPEIAELCR